MCKPNINELEVYGFIKWGKWEFDNQKNKIIYVSLDGTQLATVQDVIYAFANNEFVAYIGITTNYLATYQYFDYDGLNTINGRMDGHRTKVNSAETNFANDCGSGLYPNLYRHIKSGNGMTILYYKPITIKYDDLEIDMLRGLEFPLQRKFQAEWIIQGPNPTKRARESYAKKILTEIGVS